MGNLLRDLFPSYGVYEVLGRMSHSEFAALTTSPEYATRGAILLRTRRPQRNGELAAPPLSIGIAHFDPAQPMALDELLESARAALNSPERNLPERSSPERSPEFAAARVVARVPSPESAPQPEATLC
jgi:GGDEF domain-containing protein